MLDKGNAKKFLEFWLIMFHISGKECWTALHQYLKDEDNYVDSITNLDTKLQKSTSNPA